MQIAGAQLHHESQHSMNFGFARAQGNVSHRGLRHRLRDAACRVEGTRCSWRRTRFRRGIRRCGLRGAARGLADRLDVHRPNRSALNFNLNADVLTFVSAIRKVALPDRISASRASDGAHSCTSCATVPCSMAEFECRLPEGNRNVTGFPEARTISSASCFTRCCT